MTDSESKIKIRDFKDFFERIGGEKQLHAILKDFYERMAKDTMIGYFFDGKDLEQIASRQLQFLMKAWGITRSYTGKAPAEAHQHLPPILRGHFDRRLRLLEQTLKDHNIAEQDAQIWIRFENAFRSSIVST